MKLATLFFSLCLAATSYAQTVVSQDVEHASPSTAPNGCISVRLEVDYTLNGLSYTSAGSTVSLNSGNSTTLTANVPALRGVTITGKKVRIYGSNDTHLYTIQNAAHDYYYDNGGVDMCTGVSSDFIYEVETVSPSKFTFNTDAVLGG